MLQSELERRFDPWYEFSRMEHELSRLNREMDSIFSGLDLRTGYRYPRMDIYQNHDGVLVTAELPGVKKEDVEITVTGSTLTIKGKRKGVEPEKDERYHLRERWIGEFSRTIELPFHADADRVKARYSKGILYITLPRSEEDKPKKIALES
ncbi:MAG TPA: Hsp20/alpha crystallin family protein [Nitrospirae bacterium]|nr:spore protein SP21 [bacterium BMS3Abin08]HDO35094.1 Hsp20/alpha crystallin family protein [Nitrospirota bacterium]HDY71604.1 Hsp20/alpha crystallin family protein [Nitrospirota bacterium]